MLYSNKPSPALILPSKATALVGNYYLNASISMQGSFLIASLFGQAYKLESYDTAVETKFQTQSFNPSVLYPVRVSLYPPSSDPCRWLDDGSDGEIMYFKFQEKGLVEYLSFMGSQLGRCTPGTKCNEFAEMKSRSKAPMKSECEVGERQRESCGSSSCCCKYSNEIQHNMTMWSCFPSQRNVTAEQICHKLNGTCLSGGSCYTGETSPQQCSGVASCCCSYSQPNPSGTIDATVCTSSALCSELKGSCGPT